MSVAAPATTGSAMSEPVSPVAFRSPVGRRRFANGRTTVVSGRPLVRRSGFHRRTPPSSASSYSSGASVAAHQTTHPLERPQCPEPVAAEFGRRSPSSVAAIAATRRRSSARSKPRRRGRSATASQNAASRAASAFGCRPLTVETKRLDAFDPLSDPGELDRRARQWGRKLDDEDAAARGRDRSAPDRRTVRHQADRAEQAGGVRGAGHRSMVQVRGSGYRAAR